MDPMSLNPLSGLGAYGGMTAVGMPSYTGTQAAQRSSGVNGTQASTGLEGLASLQAMQFQFMFQMFQMLMRLMLNGGFGGAGLNGGVGTVGGVGGTGTVGGGGQGGGTAAPVAGSPAAGAGTNPNPQVQIGPGTKVLEIGDSHTVGAYGQELEKLLEGKGAKVDRYGAVGTSAGHWINGSHGAKNLQGLVDQKKPDVVIINLGANFRGGVGNDVKRLAQIARSKGAQVIWVGPPTTRQDMKNPAALKKFDQAMRAQLQGLGTYVSSAPYTPTYDGPDGIHYNSGTAKKWAHGVYDALV